MKTLRLPRYFHFITFIYYFVRGLNPFCSLLVLFFMLQTSFIAARFTKYQSCLDDYQ